MTKKDLLHFLEYFDDDMEVCYWNDGPIKINQVVETKGFGDTIVLLR